MTYESTFQLGTMDVKSWDEELNLGLKCKASPRLVTSSFTVTINDKIESRL